MKPKIFVIVGLGFIGGSLAGAIRARFRSARVWGVSRSRRNIALAQKKRLIHKGFTQLGPAISAADFVLICTPVDTIPRLILEVDRFAKPGTVVTDVGSTKREIVRWSRQEHFRRIQFIGSHPLAGSHLRGTEHARADLFEGAFVFLTPTHKSTRRALRVVSSFWRKLRLSVQVVSPEVHDRIVSQISHLPHAVASLLMQVVSRPSLRYGTTGFLDTTRVAQGDPGLWTPIFLTNRANLLGDLRRFEQALRKLIALLEKGSGRAIRRLLEVASLKRSGFSR